MTSKFPCAVSHSVPSPMGVSPYSQTSSLHISCIGVNLANQPHHRSLSGTVETTIAAVKSKTCTPNKNQHKFYFFFTITIFHVYIMIIVFISLSMINQEITFASLILIPSNISHFSKFLHALKYI